MPISLPKANKKVGVAAAAALLAGASFITMLLGLLRERLLNANFGVESLELDAYRAAFKVPDFMFFVLVSGALSVTFIPILKERLISHNRKSAWEITSSLANFLAVITAATSLLLILFADPIIRYVVAPGMNEEGQILAALMMRIIAVNPFLFAISSVFTSVQQAVGRFFFYALAPSLYNLGIIFGILVFAPRLGITGVAFGVVLGSLLQFIISALGLIGLKFDYHAVINWKNQGFRKVLSLLPARSLDQGMDYFLTLIEISLASHIAIGAINAWETAFTLHFVPISVIGIAISTAAFPQLTERLAQGRPDLFKKEIATLLRVIVWLALPTMVIAFFGRGYLVRLLVAEGNDTISDLLGLLVFSIFFRAVFHFLSRCFYAQQDTKTPLFVSIAMIALNVSLAVWFVRSGYGVRGLAMAQSIAAGFEVIVLLAILNRRYRGVVNFGFVRAITQMISASGLTGLVMYAMVNLLPLRRSDVGFFALVPKFGVIVGVSLLSYLAFSYLFGIKEANPVMRRLAGFIFRPLRVN